MPTPIFVCGAECGIAATGTASNGTEHWAAVTGSPAISTTTYNSAGGGVRSFRFNTANYYMTQTFASSIASPGTLVARFWIYFASLPTQTCMIFAADGSGNSLGVRFHVPDNTLRCGDSGAGAGAGIAVTTDTWYRVDLKLTYNTTCTVDMQVNGTSATQYTRAGSAAAIPNCYFGVMTLLLGPTADVFIDDLIVSGTSGDYPIGPGGVVGLYPNGDKTNSAATPTDGNGGHLYSAVTDFGKGSGGGTNLAAQNSESTSWQSLAKPLSTSIATNFIADATGASTEHLVWTLEDLPANAASVNGVMLVAATHSATNTTNNQSMKIKDASNNTSNAWNLLDLSENTITVPVFTFTAAPGGGAWSVSEVNGCLIQWGDSSDVNPDPYLDGVCLEVDYVPTPPRPGYNNGRNQTIAKPSLPSLIYGSAR